MPAPTPASNCQGLRPTLASKQGLSNRCRLFLPAAACNCCFHPPIPQTPLSCTSTTRPRVRPATSDHLGTHHHPTSHPARPAALRLSRSPSSRQVSRSICDTPSPIRVPLAVVAVGSLQHAPPKSSQFLCLAARRAWTPTAPSSSAPRPARHTRASVPARTTPTAILTHKGEGAGRNRSRHRAGDFTHAFSSGPLVAVLFLFLAAASCAALLVLVFHLCKRKHPIQ